MRILLKRKFFYEAKSEKKFETLRVLLPSTNQGVIYGALRALFSRGIDNRLLFHTCGQ